MQLSGERLHRLLFVTCGLGRTAQLLPELTLDALRLALYRCARRGHLFVARDKGCRRGGRFCLRLGGK